MEEWRVRFGGVREGDATINGTTIAEVRTEERKGKRERKRKRKRKDGIDGRLIEP